MQRRPLTLNEPSRGVQLPVLSADSRDAGRQQRQRRVLAAVERQRALLAGDDLAALAESVSSSHVARHLDRLGHLADGQRRGPRAGGRRLPTCTLSTDGHREAGLVGGDDVAADAHGEELVVAVGVGAGVALTPVSRLVRVTVAPATTAPRSCRARCRPRWRFRTGPARGRQASSGSASTRPRPPRDAFAGNAAARVSRTRSGARRDEGTVGHKLSGGASSRTYRRSSARSPCPPACRSPRPPQP